MDRERDQARSGFVFGHARTQHDQPAPQVVSFGADHLRRLDRERLGADLDDDRRDLS
jgi:hypothetical protein